MEMNKHYDVSGDSEIYNNWITNGFNHPNCEGERFSLILPPPNITGVLHMGHALNCTIQDILIRWNKMSGRKSLWISRTDLLELQSKM